MQLREWRGEWLPVATRRAGTTSGRGCALRVGAWHTRRTPRAVAAASVLVSSPRWLPALPEPTPSPSAGASAAPEPESSASITPQPSASPSATAGLVRIPADCREILTPAVLAQLEGIPLNDPGVGIPTGVQPDGSLVCSGRDPAADTTHLMTTITYVARGPALDMLNELAAAEGFTCYTPDGGTRCEKTWLNEPYPVTDGRTLFWRDDILIDTAFSNLAPDRLHGGDRRRASSAELSS